MRWTPAGTQPGSPDTQRGAMQVRATYGLANAHVHSVAAKPGREVYLIQACGALSTSPGSMSDLLHAGKCLVCGQAPRWREMWLVSPSPAPVWTQGEAAFGHLRSRLPCLDPAWLVAQASPGCLCRRGVQLGEISSCCNLGELRPSS